MDHLADWLSRLPAQRVRYGACTAGALIITLALALDRRWGGGLAASLCFDLLVICGGAAMVFSFCFCGHFPYQPALQLSLLSACALFWLGLCLAVFAPAAPFGAGAYSTFCLAALFSARDVAGQFAAGSSSLFTPLLLHHCRRLALLLRFFAILAAVTAFWAHSRR